jgi:hypothetical protein
MCLFSTSNKSVPVFMFNHEQQTTNERTMNDQPKRQEPSVLAGWWTVNMDDHDYDHGNDVVLCATFIVMVIGSSTGTDNDKWLRKTMYMYMILWMLVMWCCCCGLWWWAVAGSSSSVICAVCVLWLRIFYFEYMKKVGINRGQLNTRSGLHVQCVYAVMCVMVAVAVHISLTPGDDAWMEIALLTFSARNLQSKSFIFSNFWNWPYFGWEIGPKVPCVLCIVASNPALKLKDEMMPLLRVTLYSRLLWLYGVVLWWWAVVACTMCWLTREVSSSKVGTCDPLSRVELQVEDGTHE